MIKVVSNKEQTKTGPLPIAFNSDGTPLDDYKLYGTADGSGVETEGGEPTGYKLPMTVTSGEESTTTPIYIGDTKLGAEEYVDYENGNIYKRTENLFDKDNPNIQMEKEIYGSSIIDSVGWFVTQYILVKPEQKYITKLFGRAVLEYDEYYNLIRKNPSSSFTGFTTSTTTKFIRINGYITNLDSAMLVEGLTIPEAYIPYLQPTDPPVPLPEISTYSGENTLSCSEELGDKSQITYVGPVEETITKIMRTEDDGRGNVTEHVLYKEGS